MIPNNILLIFLQEDEPFPELFSNCLQRIIDMHSSWNIHQYNERDAQEILKKHLPEYICAYNSFKYNVQKADFLRIAMVYLFGGFYLDLDMYMYRPLDALRNHQVVLGEEKNISGAEQQALRLKNRLRVANYMFGGISRHSFWLLLLDHMALLSDRTIKTQQEILDVTGPGLITDLYHDYIDSYPDITLLRNTTRECLQHGHHEISCHFGDYAAHLHAGTWRKEL